MTDLEKDLIAMLREMDVDAIPLAGGGRSIPTVPPTAATDHSVESFGLGPERMAGAALGIDRATAARYEAKDH